MSQAERLRLIIKKNSTSQSRFAEEIGITRQYMSQLLSENRQIGSGIVTKIVERFNINANWLLTGEGEMYVKPSQPAPSPVEQDDSRIRELEETNRSLEREVFRLLAKVERLQDDVIALMRVNNGVEMEAKRGNIPSVSLSVENGSKSLIIRHKKGQKEDKSLIHPKHTTFFSPSLSGDKKKKEIKWYFPNSRILYPNSQVFV